MKNQKSVKEINTLRKDLKSVSEDVENSLEVFDKTLINKQIECKAFIETSIESQKTNTFDWRWFDTYHCESESIIEYSTFIVRRGGN